MSGVGYSDGDALIGKGVLSNARLSSFDSWASPTTPSLAHEAVEVVSFRLDLAPDAVAELAEFLSEDERSRAGRFAFDRDRNRYMVGRVRLRFLLAARLGVEAHEIELSYGPYGKPALSPQFSNSNLRFNVSHCADVCVCAFAHGREIGVDIEAVRQLPDADDVAARFFSPHECKAYLALRDQDRSAGFFNCWTRKEAFVKALGDGLQFPLDCFDVSLAPGEPARILQVDGVGGEACDWTMHDLSLGAGHVGAVVAGKLKV